MSHAWLMRFLEHRIGDRRMLRLIGKWLKAGVLEEGRLLTVERGTPQGAVISPLLANIFLHYVLRSLGAALATALGSGPGDRGAVRRRHGGGLPVPCRCAPVPGRAEAAARGVRVGGAPGQDPDHRVRTVRS